MLWGAANFLVFLPVHICTVEFSVAKENHETEFQLLAFGWWADLTGKSKAGAIGLYAI